MIAIHGKPISYSVVQCSTVKINICASRGSPSPLVSGAGGEVYNICMSFRAVRRTHIDGLYCRRNTDPVAVPTEWGDRERMAVIVRHLHG
jgi:hypothetical protein